MVFDFIPGVCIPQPLTPFSTSTRSYVVFPHMYTIAWNYHFEGIFYMNCEHIQLSVKLPFSLWVFEKRDDMLYSLCLMLSTLWTFKAWWWKRSASASSHLKVSHFRLLDFYWFSKQTAWSYCLICLQQIKCSSKCWFLFPFSAFFQGLWMQNN